MTAIMNKAFRDGKALWGFVNTLKYPARGIFISERREVPANFTFVIRRTWLASQVVTRVPTHGESSCRAVEVTGCPKFPQG